MKASPRPSVTYELIVNGRASPWLSVRRIEANSLDPNYLADWAAAYESEFNSHCLGLGVRFRATRRSIEVIETSPGGFQLAKNDAGWVGAHLRRLEAEGWCSKSPAVIEALEQRNNRKINRERRAELQANRYRIDKATKRFVAFVKDIKKWDAEIDAAVRAKPGWQDFATLWPKGIYMDLVIPIRDPNQV